MSDMERRENPKQHSIIHAKQRANSTRIYKIIVVKDLT
jgi:hypothetical protein